MDRSAEVRQKIITVRKTLVEASLAGVRLRGTDWFAWISAGAENTVLLASESGISEALITLDGAWYITDEIEAGRLAEEEMARGLEPLVHPWAEPLARERLVRERVGEGRVASDRPMAGESSLPGSLVRAKRTLLFPEVERYRRVGRLAAEAMTETLAAARPHWTEAQLAGVGAQALWTRGLDPALTLVAGERRLPLYRHATATREPIGGEAMLVFCARGHGLYANLTRFVHFGRMVASCTKRHALVREVEADILAACRLGAKLADIYETAANAYAERGMGEAIKEHHQGGTTGYLAREIVATPSTEGEHVLHRGTPLAWNPSVRGAKIEDTFILTDGGMLENVTWDPAWPTVDVRGRKRPLVLERV